MFIVVKHHVDRTSKHMASLTEFQTLNQDGRSIYFLQLSTKIIKSSLGDILVPSTLFSLFILQMINLVSTWFHT